MSELYLTFQRFSDIAAARELVELLKEQNIESLLVDESSAFDPSFAFNQMEKDYRVKLKKENFEVANQLMMRISEKQIDSVDKNYYLFSFTDEELIEVVAKPDEWNHFDYLLAQKILKDRDKAINPEVVQVLKKQRIQELAKPEQSYKAWVLAGYLFAFLGGLVGVFMGYHLMTHKKTLPNGDRVYAYSSDDRHSGKNIFLIGIFCFIIWMFIRLKYS